MRDEDRSALSASCDFRKECIARFTRRSFDRHLLLLPERADIGETEVEFNAAVRYRARASLDRPCTWQSDRPLVVALDQPIHKPRTGIARSSAQSMIQMANDKPFITEAD